MTQTKNDEKICDKIENYSEDNYLILFSSRKGYVLYGKNKTYWLKPILKYSLLGEDVYYIGKMILMSVVKNYMIKMEIN